MSDPRLDEILRFLNEQQIRATYGAVAAVLGVIPQSFGARLGPRHIAASWIVNAQSGLPTGYQPREMHPATASSSPARNSNGRCRCGGNEKVVCEYHAPRQRAAWKPIVTRSKASRRAPLWIPIGIVAVLTVACNSSPPAPTPSNPVCGVERWAVKTLTDPDAMRVNVSNVIPTTIAALNGFPTHCSGLPDARTFPEEFRVYEVLGIVQLTRNEEDRDVHIALAGPMDLTKTIVVEVVVHRARPRRRC